MNRLQNIFFKQVTELGGLIFYVYVLIVLFSFNQIHPLIELTISLLLTMGVSLMIKMIFFKERPNKQKAKNIIERLDASSFPSIHTMRIISLAVWLSLSYPILLFILSNILLVICVSYSRIFLKKHFLIDVAAGSVFSLAINFGLWWWL